MEIFSKPKGEKYLRKVFSEVWVSSEWLQEELTTLREIHKSMVAAREDNAQQTGNRRGSIGAKKTEFIETEIIPELEKISGKMEKYEEKAVKNIHKDQPLDKDEQIYFRRMKKFVEDLEAHVENLNEMLREEDDSRELLMMVEENLKGVKSLWEQANKLEKEGEEAVRKVRKHTISKLLRDVYMNPRKHDSGVLYYPVTLSELRDLKEESEVINNHKDPDYKVSWRFGRSKFETDDNTPIKKPHVNVNIKLFGGPKKKIHLTKKAA